MSKILIKQVRQFSTRAEARAFCTKKNKKSWRYAYVVNPNPTYPSSGKRYIVDGILKVKIKKR